MTDNTLKIVTILVAILSILVHVVLVYVRHYLAKRRSRAEQFNEAAKRFREAFSGAIKYIENREGPVHEILRVLFDDHDAARINFVPYIRCRLIQSRFDKVWRHYSNYYRDTQDIDILQRLATEDPDTAKEHRDLALEIINKLLKFAKPK